VGWRVVMNWLKNPLLDSMYRNRVDKQINSLKEKNILLQKQVEILEKKLNYLMMKFDATAHHVGMVFPADKLHKALDSE
jgi:hypothetical protein